MPRCARENWFSDASATVATEKLASTHSDRRPMTEDDLNHYYDLVETLWLGGFGTTIERIRDRTRPQGAHFSHLQEGLATLVARQWLKVQQIPIGTWSDETVYETWYVPVRETRE
jgi:hypothetical protein